MSSTKNVNISTAAYALKVANAVLSSSEFSDSLKKYDFTCANYGEICGDKRFMGSTVLDSLWVHPTFDLDLIMKNCINEYGHSEEGKHYIQSCYKKLRKDDAILPFAYIYAYHICHEYMHIIGFYHTNHKDDVAEKVGWIAYRILNRWYTTNKIVG